MAAAADQQPSSAAGRVVAFPRRNPTSDRDPQRTMASAQVALSRIGALKLPADPPSFEVWYTYISGQRPDVSQAVEEALAPEGTMTVAVLDGIHRKFFPAAITSERIDEIGRGLDRKTGMVLGLVDSAVRSTGSYAIALADASEVIDRTIDRATLRMLVTQLVSVTRQTEAQQRALHASLQQAREEISHLQTELAAVSAENLTDAVTGIANRRSFDNALRRAIGDHQVHDTPLSILMCDIDHFKRINDRFGHLTGDHALRLVAQALKMSVRGQDFLARYGGEEFAILLPDTNASQAIVVAENVRAGLSRRPIIKRSTGEHLGTLTISVGVAEFGPDDNAESFIERADSCLYIAKEKGRDQVVHISAAEAATFHRGL